MTDHCLLTAAYCPLSSVFCLLSSDGCLLPTEIKVLLKTSNFAIKNVTLCPYSKMYLL